MFFEDDFDSFNLGLVPFDTIYYKNGDAHFLAEHYKRLKRGSWVLCLNFEISYDEFKYRIREYVCRKNERFGAIRVVYFKNQLLIFEKRIRYTNDLFEKGLDLTVSKVKKDPINILNYIKTFNMGINQIEEARAKEKGYDSCLFLNKKGHICEAAFSNIFFRRGNEIFTPHLSCGLLPGVMRKKVCEVAKDLGYVVKKEFLTLNDLTSMDECFITSSVAGVFPVQKIGKLEFKSRTFAQIVGQMEYFKRPWVE